MTRTRPIRPRKSAMKRYAWGGYCSRCRMTWTVKAAHNGECPTCKKPLS